MKFRTVVVDPPWSIRMGGGVRTGGSGKYNKGYSKKWSSGKVRSLGYGVMEVEEIGGLDIDGVMEGGAHCYIWTINRYIEETYWIMRKWGFVPGQLLVWCKAPMGYGLGGAFVGTTEYILTGRRGGLKNTDRIDSTWWNWKRGKHSVKPEAFQDIVERVSPGPYLEVFARRMRMGWECIGNGIDGLDVRVALEGLKLREG